MSKQTTNPVIPSQAEREQWQRQIDAAIAPHTPGAIWWDRCKSLLAALTQLEAERDKWKAREKERRAGLHRINEQRKDALAQRDTAYGLLREAPLDSVFITPEWKAKVSALLSPEEHQGET